MKTETKTQELITREMTIGDVVGQYPYLAEIMTSYGLHCIGCHANPYESILNGCLGHGMDTETVDKLVEDLNNAIEGHKDQKEFTITEKAATKLKEFMSMENKNNYGLRLGVHQNSGGCGDSSIQYSLDFAEKADENEATLNDKGINVFVEKSMAQHMHGLKIDFIENEKGSGFKIESNLDMKDSGCGCSQ